MKRLYLKIYLTIVFALLLVVLIAGGIWRLKPPAFAEGFEVAGELVAAVLPPAGAPAAVQQAAVQQFAQRLGANLGLFDKDLQLIASYGDAPIPPPDRSRPGFMPGHGAWSLPLPDGRWIVARGTEPRHPAIGLILLLGGIALVIALCAFPVVRGLTRRLERLQAGVETLGSGNLTTRVKVEGCDEVAGLAASFNRAAARIEELVNAHRLMLAHASHEIRTPLSRIRLGIEMLAEKNDPKYKAALSQDIAELDALVDDILLASRLDMIKVLPQPEHVDLLATGCRRGRALRRLRGGRRTGHRHCRSPLLAPPDPQPAGQRDPPRQAASDHHGVACGHRRADRCLRRRQRHPGRRARARVRAVLPDQRRHQGLRPRHDAGASASRGCMAATRS